MPQQFVVPQFLDVESKIIGPITVRQFCILMAVSLFDAILYKIFDFSLYLSITVPLFIAAVVIAFVRINGQPFHYFLINFIQTLRRPARRVWSKHRSDAELRAKILKKSAPPPPMSLEKPSLSGSRLRDLSLVVNTGGGFMPADARENSAL